MRALMFMLFGRMIVKGSHYVPALASDVSVYDARVSTRSNIQVTFNDNPGGAFTVTKNDGQFIVTLIAGNTPIDAHFDWVAFN